MLTHPTRHRRVRHLFVATVALLGVVAAACSSEDLQEGGIPASAEYRPVGEPGKSTDLGGCVNVLNSSKPITPKSHGIRPNTTLIQIEKWTGVDTWKPAEVA